MAPQQPFVRTDPTNLVRVGIITGPGGHAFGSWGDGMNPTAGKIRTTGMIMTHLWSPRLDVTAKMQDKFPTLEAVDHPAQMIGHIDGIIIDDINAVSLFPQLARPFIEAGIPTFVNRPFANSLAKGQEMVDLAAQHGTALLSASTWEYSESVGDLRAKVGDLPAINGYVAHNSMSDYYTHGLHGVWYIHAVLRDQMEKGQGRVTAASYVPDWRTPRGLIVYEHESLNGPYYGTLQQISGADGPAYMRVFGDHNGDVEGRIPARAEHIQYNTWNALQLVIQEMFETGVSPQTGDHLMEKLAMFLLPFYSILECDGNLVRRQELEGWELPPPCEALIKDGKPNDNAFITVYSEAELAALESKLT